MLVYHTSASDRTLLSELNKVRKQKFIVYGLRRDDVVGNCVVKNFSEEGFVRDLSSARAVLTNGGLSLLHEAIFLGKPILSVPVRHQFEQEMNARYLERCGYGLGAPQTEAAVLEAFLAERDKYASRLRKHRQTGNEVTFDTVDGLLKRLT